MYYITIVSISILQTNKEWLHLFTKLLNCGLQEKLLTLQISTTKKLFVLKSWHV